MAFYSLVILSFLFLLEKSLLVSAGCQVPPQFWCDNPDISAQCGVTQQCKTFHHSNSNLVNFALYYESMCPDCKNYFKTQLAPAYEKVGTIMNLTLVPYGKATYRYVSDLPFKYTFECQHGPEECIGNMLETCAIHMYKDIDVYFPFIRCVEDSFLLPRKAAVQCATTYKLNYTSIMDCVNSYEGHLLEYDMAKQTGGLRPSLNWVPWVTLNGVHTDEIQKMASKDLVKLICKTYTGSSKPPACPQ